MGHFGSAFENKPGAKSTLSRGHGFQEDPFSKCVLGKPRSRDGLVWTVGLFVEIKLS